MKFLIRKKMIGLRWMINGRKKILVITLEVIGGDGDLLFNFVNELITSTD